MASTMPSELNILKDLPYYRLGLAAKQLGCEVSDLIYFGVNGLVTLYLMLPTEHVASIYSTKIMNDFKNNQDIDSNSRGGNKSDKLIFDSNTFMRHLRIEAPDELEESDISLRALIKGFWELPPYILNDINDDMLPDMKNFSLRISAKTNEGDVAYADLNEWDFIPTIDDLYLKQSDFIQLYKSLTEGIALQMKTKSSSEQEAQAKPTEKINITTRQSDAIVEALKMAGFTEKELNGSIGELQKKFAEKGAAVLASVDKNTLDKWLKSVRNN